MIEVFILKIENPDCFWVHIKGGGNFVDTEMEYKNLQAEMNLFYNKSYRYVDGVKPSVVEEGQVCAVYCQELKCWCRAVVKTIISCTDCLAECFLVDYAKCVPVKINRICVALESFMRLPYRAKRFRLYCAKPVTLRVDYFMDSAEIVPSNRWDIAAIQYFQTLLNATTQVEAKLCAVQEDSFDVYLYVTIKGEKVCVNDDLVAKNFAYYDMMKDTIPNTLEDQEKQQSVRHEPLAEEINPALVLWPTLLQAKDSEILYSKWIYSVTLNFDTSCLESRKKLKLLIRYLSAVSDDIESMCNNQQEIASHDGVTGSNLVVAVSPLNEGITFSVQADEETDSALCKQTTEIKKEMEKDLEKKMSVKLLQFLNPDLLKAADRQDETEEFQLNISASLPIFLSHKIEPCPSLETSPLFPALKKELLQNRFKGPSHVQSYSWPPIARGFDSVIISSENDPLVYLPPIITFLQSQSCYLSLPARNGPLALIICPGQKKAEHVFQLLEICSRCSRPLHPILLLLGMDKEEIKNVTLPRGCEIIVTTPHSLLRLLECHRLLFLRLCHLVFDEVGVLFSEANEQMFNILEYYKNNLSVEEKEYAPQQIVAVGSHWSKNMELVIKKFMNDPYVVITSLEEAAIYANVQQVVQACSDCDRICMLLQILDFTPADVQKTLIFTSSLEEAKIVYEAVKSTSIFCLKMCSGIEFHFNHVVEQWNKKFSSGTHVVLVLTDDCLPALGITDGTRVVHFSFPASPKVFGARLYSMSANFQHSIEKASFLEHGQSNAKSILLLTEKSACHAVGLLRYLERAETKIPPELRDFTAGVLEAQEDSKSRRPLCRYLKIYGVCMRKKHCPDRHRINLQIDLPRKVTEETLPTAGNVTILPLFIMDATNYFGRIIGKQKDQYVTLAEEMNEYYKKASNLISVDTVEKLAMYGLHKKGSFHRVQVLEVAPKEESVVFYSVHIKYIDDGRVDQVQNYQLLNLPETFQALPPQAVEFIICRVKPIDNEIEWNPKVTRYINNKIREKPHEAKIVLALGNTVWLDPVVQVTRLEDLNTSINEYNIRSEILSTGMGVDNPEHMQELKRLFRDAEIAVEQKDLTALFVARTKINCGENAVSLSNESRTSFFLKAETVQVNPVLHGTGEQTISVSQSIVDQTVLNLQNLQKQVTSNVQSAKECDAITEDGNSQVTLQNHYDELDKNKREDQSPQPSNQRPPLTINQIISRSSQAKCDEDNQPQVFSPSPASQSACAGNKSYLADMELKQSILKEKSTCVLKNGEPVIILAKEEEEAWSSLLKHKNPNVSFDFDYLEVSKEKCPFLAGPKRVYQNVTMLYEEEEESPQVTDTESDDSSIY